MSIQVDNIWKDAYQSRKNLLEQSGIKLIAQFWSYTYILMPHFSFAPVISASSHRYVNYSDIQVLMMVTETETLTLHHNKFTYLDYVFLLPSYVCMYLFYNLWSHFMIYHWDKYLLYVSLKIYLFTLKNWGLRFVWWFHTV